MNSLKPIPNLKKLSTQLLEEDLTHEDSITIINEIHGYFNEITTISGYDMEFKHLAAVPTASGMALSLNHAAQCLLDYKRTIKFLKGLVSAIKDAQKEKPNQTIQIFYAGCGPYAPFITLVAPLFDISEVQFSLLEINKESLDYAKKLINELSLTKYIKGYYQADAVTFTIPDPNTFDILYSETLDALLFRESYVPILASMLPQLSPDITVIPTNVLLKVDVISNNTNDASSDTKTYTIFDTRQAIGSIETELPQGFTATDILFESNKSNDQIIIDTEVHIYENLRLTRGESSLTIPYEIPLENPTSHKKISFTYLLTPQVGLKYEFL
ncbi:phytanoyl-CoA dioxygenase [Aquimarina sp. 2201CG14-23]|uniref:phytanoyl-CoA dioxygenase n=1 Tax=Aquimarina mycalae TaxID=3040073 RepID=UPI002477EC87|nr:phytanoyl-CoA dioxygenase [Aquimarina sp. 2201CG14-23]MDH7445675.1 phytanoyl-CoA dioxygenase [Aquimarina sp. 2201CG14-23]